MSPATTLVELLLILLIAASVVALVASRLRIPYTAALVFAGIAIDLFRTPISTVFSAIGTAPGSLDILTPDVIFTLFLPGLLFESSLHLKLSQVRENIGSIVVLAVAGVVVATVVTGYGVAWMTGLPTGSALVFGALISATDPISVVALFRSMGLPSRLTLLIEGESLFNDGTAIVLFQVLLVALRPGQSAGADAVFRFVVVTGGGLGLGAVVGYVASKLASYVGDRRQGDTEPEGRRASAANFRGRLCFTGRSFTFSERRQWHSTTSALLRQPSDGPRGTEPTCVHPRGRMDGQATAGRRPPAQTARSEQSGRSAARRRMRVTRRRPLGRERRAHQRGNLPPWLRSYRMPAPADIRPGHEIGQ